MKKIIFIIGISLIAGLLIYVSLFKQKFENLDDINISELLSEKAQMYSFDENKSEFVLTNSIYGDNIIFYKKLNPIDGIYYMSKNPDPIKIDKEEGGKTIITVKEGIYLFVLNDIFNKYEIKNDNLKILQQGKGLFLFNNISDNFRLFSYNSILKVSLISTNKVVTSFDLLPSLILLYNPNFNKDIKNVDILRVSTVDPISYLDTKEDNFPEKLFGNKENINTKFLQIVNKDFKNRIKKFNLVFNDILKSFKGETLKGEGLILSYKKLFINDLKKEAYIKNEITKSLINYLKILSSPEYKNDNTNYQSRLIEYKTNIKSNLKYSSGKLYNEGINIIKKYYYLSYFSNILSSNDDILIKNNFKIFLNEIFGDKIKENDYFSKLSDIYLSYNFGEISKEDLYFFVNRYVEDFIKNKNLTKEEYLTSSFFLVKYIYGNSGFSNNILLTIIYSFQTTDKYYSALNSNSDKKHILPIDFFNFSSIISRLNDDILKTFFIKNNKGYILKDEYSTEYNQYFPKETLDNLILIYKIGTNYQKSKKDDFYKFIQNNKGNIIDNYVLLEEKFSTLKNIIDIINNYPDYLLKLQLNKQNREIVGLSVDDNSDVQILSEESLKKYLSQFNNLDITSIKIGKNYKKDGFYEVSVNILNNKFKFKLNPKGNTVFDLVYTDISGKEIKTYQTLPISFDSKEKIFTEACKLVKDSLSRYKCDFKNIFEVIYLMDSSNNSNNIINLPPPVDNLNQMTVGMKVFVQKELIDKDFKIISNFLNIGFASIFAKITNGEYDINITNVNGNFQGKTNRIYNVEIYGKYIFKIHSFSNLNLKIKQEEKSSYVFTGPSYEFNGAIIEISPSTIFIKDFESKMKNLGYFIDTLNENYKGTGNYFKFDLNSGNVYIDSEVFNININNLGRNSFQ